MSKRRMTKQELKRDPFVQSVEKVQDFYEFNKKVIIGIGIALFLIIAGGIGYYYYMQSQERKAEQLMADAEDYLLQADYQHALNGSEEDFTVGFEQIINNYGSTKAGNLARYYAAVCEYNLGNKEEALQNMEDYQVPEGILGVAPLSFKGVLLSDLGQYEQAGATYVQAAEWDQNDSTTPYNYMQAANSYFNAKDYESARTYANNVVDEYPNSTEVTEAERLLGQLTSMESVNN